jgi:predicted TPR repeat methyltransferase
VSGLILTQRPTDRDSPPQFNEYAHHFESELVGKLRYRTPAKIDDALTRAINRADGVLSSAVAVDIGCGTGLAGEVLRSRCIGRLVGCDLSPRMLAVAAQKRRADGDEVRLLSKHARATPECQNSDRSALALRARCQAQGGGSAVFDELLACDAVTCLQRHVAPGSADLIVAADVLVYMRELHDLFVRCLHMRPARATVTRPMPWEAHVACWPHGCPQGWTAALRRVLRDEWPVQGR